MILSNSRLKGAQSCFCAVVLLAFVCALSSASAEIKLTDSLSVSGFLDMSSTTTSGGDETEIGLSFDQFELDFKIEQGSVTGYVDIDRYPCRRRNKVGTGVCDLFAARIDRFRREHQSRAIPQRYGV